MWVLKPLVACYFPLVFLYISYGDEDWKRSRTRSDRESSTTVLERDSGISMLESRDSSFFFFHPFIPDKQCHPRSRYFPFDFKIIVEIALETKPVDLSERPVCSLRGTSVLLKTKYDIVWEQRSKVECQYFPWWPFFAGDFYGYGISSVVVYFPVHRSRPSLSNPSFHPFFTLFSVIFHRVIYIFFFGLFTIDICWSMKQHPLIHPSFSISPPRV